jgi:hypothetical protein
MSRRKEKYAPRASTPRRTRPAGPPKAAAALADPPAGLKAEMSLKEAIDYFGNMMLEVNISAIAENDQHVLYTVRVPRESLGPDPYPCGLADEKFCADVSAFMAARIRELRKVGDND